MMMIHSCQRQYTIGTVLICFLSTFFGVTVAQQKQVRFVDAPYQPISNEVIQTECPETSSCVPVYLCSIGRFASLNQPTSCQRKNNNQGICCPNSVNEQSVAAAASAPAINDAVHDPLNSRRSGARLSSAALHDAEITARSEMHNTRNLEQNIERRTDAYANDAEHTHSAFFGNNPIVNRLAHQGELLVHMSRSLSNRNGRNASTGSGFSLGSFQPSTFDRRECPQEPRCRATNRYRTTDGSCSNLQHPLWATATSPFQRVLLPDYADGIGEPRVALSGRPLPNARALSVSMSPIVRRAPAAELFTVALMQFGQFLDHDIILTALTRTQSGGTISCCDTGNRRPMLRHPLCMPITISANDPFFGSRGQRCMSFIRSAAATRLHCELGAREQMNQVTSVIDASMIYGSSETAQQSLRSFNNGQLLIHSGGSRQLGVLMPSQTNGTCNVPIVPSVSQCFRAGDIRVNENVHLTVLQTLFLRFHNSIASRLAQINSNWPDAALFEETRRIVGALIQHFTYNELLPAILGHDIMIRFGLLPLRHGYFLAHNPNVNPSILSGFSTAAYRFHSMVQGSLQMIQNDGRLMGEVPLAETFNNPTLLRRPGALDGLINGMTTQAQQQMDHLFTEQLQNHLFRPHNATSGLDLVAINIQRGRDHGIPGYNRWREACGLPVLRSFSDLSNAMPRELAQFMRNHYESVDDIDLFVAGTAEYHLPSALVGPTFGCIVAEQFRRLKVGDRFYYENGNQESSFTPTQLRSIRRMTIARVFCDHGDAITTMQPYAFIKPAFWWNQKLSCRSRGIPRLNLRPWANTNVLG